MASPENLGLHVLAFDDPLRARELLLACVRMQRDGTLGLTDAVFVHRDAETGKVRVEQTIDPTPGTTAAEGAFMGVLLGTLLLGPIGGLAVGAVAAGGGALAAKLIDLGVPESFLDDVKAAVPPGSTALVLQASHLDQAVWQEELRRFPDARSLSAQLPPEARVQLADGFTPTPTSRCSPSAA